MNLNRKKLLLIGFILILLVGIPVTVYLLQKQQETRSRAQAATILKFAPDSSQTNPIQKKIGDSIPLDIMVDPGTNLVSFVKLQIQYDADKLSADQSSFVPNTVVFPTVLEGPIYSPGKIEITLSVGPDPTKAVQTVAKAGTVTFKALANTAAGQPTLVTYGQAVQVLSIGSSDQASENVLSATNPAAIAIGDGSTTTTPTTSPSLNPIPTGTLTPTPDATETPSPSPTTTALATPTPTLTGSPAFTPTPTGTGSASTNQNPVCNSLAVDRATTGAAPFSITFTANGTDTDGTISKVNFNFGDGEISGDITTSGGIGTNSVNVSTSHTYNNAGTYTASAILTDSNGGASSATGCQQTIIVQSGSTPTPGSGSTGSTNPTYTPTPTMAATGAFETAMGIGAVAMFLIIGGGILFFML